MAEQDRVPISSFLDTLWRYKLLIIIGTLLGLGVGLGIARMQPTIYLAESRIFLSSQSGFDALSDGPFSSDALPLSRPAGGDPDLQAAVDPLVGPGGLRHRCGRAQGFSRCDRFR